MTGGHNAEDGDTDSILRWDMAGQRWLHIGRLLHARRLHSAAVIQTVNLNKVESCQYLRSPDYDPEW